jgi:chaperonin GroEL
VVVTKDDCAIVGGAGDKQAIAARMDRIRKEMRDSTSEYDKEKLHERLAKLSGGVAVIRVGAPSEAELKNRKDAFEDAISSCRAAVAEGVVPGCGLQAGIIDPTKVVRLALENAVSVASVLLLTEATLTEIPEKKNAESSRPGLEA